MKFSVHGARCESLLCTLESGWPSDKKGAIRFSEFLSPKPQADR